MLLTVMSAAHQEVEGSYVVVLQLSELSETNTFWFRVNPGVASASFKFHVDSLDPGEYALDMEAFLSMSGQSLRRGNAIVVCTDQTFIVIKKDSKA